MNNPWREIGFISRPKKHLKVIRIKKRIARRRKIFKQRQKDLIQLHLRNRIKYLIIEHLEYMLADIKTKKKTQISLKENKTK
ncbi:uncharacterized protein LOC119561822 [Drosophila subpulchrella]|uniref:uncharacterized protein LOC119561822 n=1 Tax=Drosophila subpulchrella TaxID=1486046 RepID=UPI0018A16042|nr:uncharacterized protein LOC119561822 [Drosophila subpulchrella]